MNKHIIIGVLFLSMVFLLSNSALSQETEIVPISIDTDIKDTTFDYTPYREVVVGDAGVVYHIRIKNTGTREKTYEVIPNTGIIRDIGTYRIDPSDKITLEPGEEQIVYFYLAVEKEIKARTVIPIEIRSGLSETTIDVVARPIGLFIEEEQRAGWIVTAFKVILIIVLVIIIIIALILSFRKTRKKKEEPDEELTEFDEDAETYY